MLSKFATAACTNLQFKKVLLFENTSLMNSELKRKVPKNKLEPNEFRDSVGIWLFFTRQFKNLAFKIGHQGWERTV